MGNVMSDIISIMVDQLRSAAFEKEEKDKSGKDKPEEKKK